MSLNNLLNQFLGSTPSSASDNQGQSQGLSQTLSGLASNIPGGLAGGAAAGGIMALLMSNKSARKYAGTAAKYGGAAILGGLAFKAYKNWQNNDPAASQQASTSQVAASSEETFHQQAIEHSTESENEFEMNIIKAMIAAARADGHIDAQEQQSIFQAVEKMQLSAEDKAIVFDSLQKDIPVKELAHGISTMELKAEIYLASCLVIDPDHPAEREHLDKLGAELALPRELLQQLELQAHQAYAEAA
ncbi:MAG: tellurite resistance TerB family protein [Gammaproteobacteria bacterium]|nr:tellurite resistance TerB family protein [Gammaproteobacteria bacterium]NNJ51034.1 tellurite resistance TerB family protein [Gammaproteobacteria bacterium]